MLVSVYMPTKNRLESLKLAVDSVLSQTHEEVELIIVDDASSDGTADYLAQLVQKDNRVRYLRQETSKGACAARNLAIKSSTGEFITGLDDDDEFEHFHIEALLAYWQLIYRLQSDTSCIYVQYKYRIGNSFKLGKKESYVKADDMLFGNAVGNQIFAPREIFFSAGLFDEEMPAWQDLEFFYRVLKQCGPARLLDVNSYIFDITPRGDRISSSQKDRILIAYSKMITRHNITNPRQRQALLMQVYSDYYGFDITLNDVFSFYKEGFWFHGWKTMLKRYFKAMGRRIKK